MKLRQVILKKTKSRDTKGRQARVFSDIRGNLKGQLESEVERTQKRLSGLNIYNPETNIPLAKLCKSLLLTHSAYTKALRSNSSSSSTNEKAEG